MKILDQEASQNVNVAQHYTTEMSDDSVMIQTQHNIPERWQFKTTLQFS